MDDQITRDPIVTRASAHDDDLILRRSRGKSPSFHYTALGKGKSDRNMEPFLIEVAPEAMDTSSSHQGEEFIYVLDGTLRVEYGRAVHTLQPGDSIYYNSIVPHAVSAEGGPARILAVIYFPL
jgi:quercetin dioxygenase-like cupin family protein